MKNDKKWNKKENEVFQQKVRNHTKTQNEQKLFYIWMGYLLLNTVIFKQKFGSLSQFLNKDSWNTRDIKWIESFFKSALA